jgi:hypothetical protein
MERSICLITAEERNKSLDEALARIKKQYGQGSVMKLDDNPSPLNQKKPRDIPRLFLREKKGEFYC